MAEIGLHEYVQQLKQMIEQGRYDEIVAHGRHILEQYPKYVEVYRVLGEAMLEAEREADAKDMFQRVLSSDPENFVAHAGMSVIFDRQGDLDKALWHMERAFELAPDNPAIRGELRRLYGRKTGVEPGRLDLTRAALARLYLRGGHYQRAIEELEAILAENPQRLDVEVALAEALWRNEQRVRAEEVCLDLLEKLPFCLKANLILAEIYTRAGREEADACLEKARALDPENRVAQRLLGDRSPLPLTEIRIERLEYAPPEAERPAWAPAEEAIPSEIEKATEPEIVLPAWLEEMSAEEQPSAVEEAEEEGLELPPWLVETPEAVTPEAPTFAELQTPEIETEAPGEAPPPEPAEIPDWVREMAPPEVREAPERGPEEEAPPHPEIPEWLAEEAPPTEEKPAEAPEVPEWLSVVEPAVEEAPAEQPPAPEVPDWLAEAAPAAEEGMETLPEAAAEGEAGPPEVPEWLTGEGLPSGDEALAWLESLMEGKEEELRAAAEAEAEARAAEILGKPTPTELPETAEEPTPEPIEEPSEAVPPVEEALELPPWLQETRPLGAPEEPVEAPAPEIPEWLAEAIVPPEAEVPPSEPPQVHELEAPEVPRAPTPEEAFGWTAFEEEEEEVAPEAGPSAPEEAPAEGFGWIGFEEEAPAAPEFVPSEEAPQEVPTAPEVVEGPPKVAAPPTEVRPPEAAEAIPEPAPTEEVEAEAIGPEEVEWPDLETLRAHVRANPRDHEARLELARALWQAGRHEESLETYSRLLRRNKLVDETLADLESYVEERPDDTDLQRALGDAYMRLGRLEAALAAYRNALKAL